MLLTSRLRYVLYGALASAGLISLSVQAAGSDGVFGDYFTNMTTPCAPMSVLTGLSNTVGATFGTSQCVPLQTMIGTIFGSSSAPSGQAMLGFNLDGTPKYGFVNWQKTGSDIFYLGGNIGIGTPNPTAKLEVVGQIKIIDGSEGVDKVLTSNASGVATWRIPTPMSTTSLSGGLIGTVNYLTKYTPTGTGINNSQVYDNATNVGIGTASPVRKLDVNGDIINNGWYRSRGITGWYNETYGGGLYMVDTTWLRSYFDKSLWLGAGYLGSDGGLIVGYGGVGSPAGGAIISGNVGIGTTTPGSRLHINSSTDNILRLNKTSGSNWNYIEWMVGGVRRYWSGIDNIGRFSIQSDSNNSILLNPIGGNVGIGTATPTAKLEVNGDVRAYDKVSLGRTSVDYLPAASNWNYTLQLNGSDTTSIGFYDSGSNAGSIRYNNNQFTIGGNDGGGVANTLFPGNINAAGSPAPMNGYNLGVGSIGATTVYGYTAICTGNASGDCSNNNGVVLGPSNSFATVNIPNIGVTFFNGGNVGIGTVSPSEKLEVSGNIKATAFLYSSDKNLKKNITPLTGALDKILNLNGYTFDWKDTGRSDIGVIAQEVEAVFPTIVHTSEHTGMKSVEYGNLIAPLIEAIKSEQKTIEEQNQKIQSLEARLKRLEAQMQK